MADLTKDAYILVKDPYSEKWTVNTSVAQEIYKGQPMIIDQDVDTDNLTPFVDAVVVAPTDVFIGISTERKTFASGDREADALVELYMEPTIVGFQSAVFSKGDEGKTVYMSDSATLSAVVADNPQIGKVHNVDDGFVFVRLISPQICTGA